MKKSFETFASTEFALKSQDLSSLRGGDTVWDWISKMLSTTTENEEPPTE